MSGILRLESLTKGNTLKQGDKTPLKYKLFDADGEKLNIAGKSAVVRLMYPDFLRVGYESEPLTVSSDNTVTFSIDKIIQPVLYYLEITVDGKYIFPSRNDESKLNIDKSSQGSDAAVIEIIGKDVLVRDVKNMVDSEIKPVVNDMIISNKKVIENEKIVKDVQILSEQLEARQNQVEQFNNQVITEMTDKDVISAPELIEARKGEAKLSARLDKEYNEVTEQLAQIVAGDAITPEQFEGNDYEKVQQAVNYIHSNKRGFVALSRMYNITGHPPINIPKTASSDRSPLIFGGRGGGIIKQDSGWMFDSENRNTGDVYFSNVIFESINGQGTGIINGANLIRTQWHNSHARNVDRILHSDTYTQTNIFNGGSIIGGSGWAFNAEGYYDLVMTGGLLVEHREHFFKQEIQEGSTNIHNALYNVRFRDILVEGLSGKTFDFQRIESMVVDGVYLESNMGGYFDFTRADNVDCVQISNVRCYNAHNFVVENNITALIEWGGYLLGVSTHNIFSKNLPIHDATLARSQALKIYSHQDVALDSSRNTIDNIDPYNIVIEENKTQAYMLTSDKGSYRPKELYGVTSNNLDDYIKTGAFNVDSRTHTNTPDVVDNWGIIDVKDMSSGIILQTYIERPSTRMHMRIKGGGSSWGDWVLK